MTQLRSRITLVGLGILAITFAGEAALRERPKKFLISEDPTWRGLLIHVENGLDDTMSIQFPATGQDPQNFLNEDKTKLFSVGKFKAADGIYRIDIHSRNSIHSLFSKIVKAKGALREELFDASNGFLASIYRTDQGKIATYRFNDQNGNVIAQLFRTGQDWDLDVYRRTPLKAQYLLSWSCFEIRDRWLKRLKKNLWLASGLGAGLLLFPLAYLYYPTAALSENSG